MANDDVNLPTSMVGKKIAPIFADGSSAPRARRAKPRLDERREASMHQKAPRGDRKK